MLARGPRWQHRFSFNLRSSARGGCRRALAIFRPESFAMDTASEDIDCERRRLVGFAVMCVAARAAISLLPENATAATEDAAIRSLRVNVPDAQLADIRPRLDRT